MKNIFAALCCFLLVPSVYCQKTVILAKTLIDGTGAVIDAPAIVIENGRILSAGKKDRLPKDASIIDLGNYTILPGLIDAHVHPYNDADDDYQLAHLKHSSASKALTSLHNVQDLLAAAWTTLRVAGDADLGCADFEVRNAINKRLFTGPHIYGAGHYMSVTGGGGDINFFSYEQEIVPDVIAVKGDPLKDISELQRVRFVMIGGKVVKNETK